MIKCYFLLQTSVSSLHTYKGTKIHTLIFICIFPDICIHTFYTCFFPKKIKQISFLEIMNSQWLQQILSTDISNEWKKLCIPNQDNKKVMTCLAFPCNKFYFSFLKINLQYNQLPARRAHYGKSRILNKEVKLYSIKHFSICNSSW